MTAVVIIFLILNVLFWIIGAIRFDKKFSTEAVIEKTRAELNRLLMDINRNAERNISLIEDRIKKLKEAVSEADSHLEIMKVELQKSAEAAAFKEKLEAVEPAPKKQKRARAGRVHAPIEAYAVEQSQGNLFSAEEPTVVPLPEKKRAPTPVKRPAAIQNESALDVPEIYASSVQITPKKDFKKQARELADLGMTVEEIAVKLSRSTQEIEFVLEFS